MESCSCGFDESRIGSPAYFADQYAVWDELRETCGVHASQLFNGWVLTRYREVDSCLRDTDNFSNAAATARKIERYPEELRERARPLLAYLDSRSVLFQDPPEHTKQRRILARAFVPHHIANLEGTVREMTRALLFVVISLTFIHAAHKVRFILVDLGLKGASTAISNRRVPVPPR